MQIQQRLRGCKSRLQVRPQIPSPLLHCVIFPDLARHGAYIVASDGFSNNSAYSDYNNTLKFHKFGNGAKLLVEVDNKSKQITF